MRAGGERTGVTGVPDAPARCAGRSDSSGKSRNPAPDAGRRGDSVRNTGRADRPGTVGLPSGFSPRKRESRRSGGAGWTTGATDPTKAVPPQGPPSRAERQAMVDRLCRHFACDALTAPELERRPDRAYAASTRAELAALERDLPAPGPGTAPSDQMPQRRPVAATGLRDTLRERDLVVSIWGGTGRSGSWTRARRLTALTPDGRHRTRLPRGGLRHRRDIGARRHRDGRRRDPCSTGCGSGVDGDRAHGRCHDAPAECAGRSGWAGHTGQRPRCHGRRRRRRALPGESGREARKRRRSERKSRRRKGPGNWPGSRS